MTRPPGGSRPRSRPSTQRTTTKQPDGQRMARTGPNLTTCAFPNHSAAHSGQVRCLHRLRSQRSEQHLPHRITLTRNLLWPPLPCLALQRGHVMELQALVTLAVLLDLPVRGVVGASRVLSTGAPGRSHVCEPNARRTPVTRRMSPRSFAWPARSALGRGIAPLPQGTYKTTDTPTSLPVYAAVPGVGY
jgi:hypothetical protein